MRKNSLQKEILLLETAKMDHAIAKANLASLQERVVEVRERAYRVMHRRYGLTRPGFRVFVWTGRYLDGQGKS